MADFSTGVELEVEVSSRSLRSAKDTIESELGDLEVGVDAVVSGAGGGGGGGMTNPRRRARWEQQRTEDLGDILDVLEDIDERVGGGDGGGSNLGLGVLLGRASGAAGGAAGAAGGLIGGTAGIAGAAAAAPLLGGALGLGLRGMGFGARANNVDTTPPWMQTREEGAQTNRPQGPSDINVRISKPNWVPIRVQGTPAEFDGSRGQNVRNPLAGGTLTQTVEVNNQTQVDVTVEEPDTQRIVDETRREVERDFTRLRQKIEQGLGGGPGGPL